jgi:flagellin
MGFNEVKSDGSVTGQQVLWYNGTDENGEYGRMTLDDTVEINGVKLGTSSDGSAASKASAINAVSADTGVSASAYTEVILALNLNDGTIDLTQYDDGTTQKFTINGTIINLTDIYNDSVTGLGVSQASNLNDIVTAVQSYGVQGVEASATSDGNLKLTSVTGQNITVVDDDGNGAEPAAPLIKDFTAATGGLPVSGSRTFAEEDAFDTDFTTDTDLTDGFTVNADANFGDGVTFGGRITLSSAVGAEVNIKGDYLSLRKLGLNEMGGSSSSVGGSLTIMTQEAAGRAITKLDGALDSVALERANLGAFQNRLTAAVDNLNSSSTNLSEARSRILDADYASVTTELARSQIIQQAATAMLAQANQQPQTVLSLLS